MYGLTDLAMLKPLKVPKRNFEFILTPNITVAFPDYLFGKGEIYFRQGVVSVDYLLRLRLPWKYTLQAEHNLHLYPNGFITHIKIRLRHCIYVDGRPRLSTNAIKKKLTFRLIMKPYSPNQNSFMGDDHYIVKYN